MDLLNMYVDLYEWTSIFLPMIHHDTLLELFDAKVR